MAAFPQQISRTSAAAKLPHRVKPLLSTSTSFGDTVLSQVADGGGWVTLITIVNLRPTSNSFSLNCYGDDGNPNPFSWAGIGTSSGLNGSLAGNGSVEVSTSGTSLITNQGWCYLDTIPSDTGDIAGFAIYRYAPTGQEVSVNAESELSTSLILAFDNTKGYSYGVALVNADENTCGFMADQGTVSIKDQTGVEFAAGTFDLPSCGHTAFMLAAQFPETANRAGTITFTLTSGMTLSGLGLRASPTGSLTSIALLEPMSY